jgi:RimJ/RimL family protein N-acetyltransferase
MQVFEFADIRFRPLEKEDLKLLHVWENDFEVMMYSRSKPLNVATMTQLEERYAEWMKKENDLYFIVENLETKEPLGFSRIGRELWGNVPAADIGTYIGKKELWEKGFGKKITVALLEMAFIHLNLDRCEAWSIEYNTRAHSVLEFCGFKKGGVVRQTTYVSGRKWNSYHFDILKEEYLSIRMSLLKKILGEKVDAYLKRTQPVFKSN